VPSGSDGRERGIFLPLAVSHNPSRLSMPTGYQP